MTHWIYSRAACNLGVKSISKVQLTAVHEKTRTNVDAFFMFLRLLDLSITVAVHIDGRRPNLSVSVQVYRIQPNI